MAEEKVSEVEAGATREKAAKAKRKKSAQTTFTDPAVAKRNLYVLALLVALIVMPGLNQTPVVKGQVAQLGLRSYDLMVQANDAFRRWAQPVATPPRDVAVVGIDEPSLERYGRWPWNRSVVAELVDALHALGARTVALDILFAESQWSPLEGLPELTAALPEEARTPELLASLESLDKLQAYLMGLPPEIQSDPVVRELQRRLVPPWEDELLRRSIAKAGNVVLGLAASRSSEADSAGVWLGGGRAPAPPYNLEQFIKRKIPDFSPEEIRQLWEMEELHHEFFNAGPFPKIVIGRIGEDELALEDMIEGLHDESNNVTVSASNMIRSNVSTRAVGLQLPLPQFLVESQGAGYMNDTEVKDAVVRQMTQIFFLGDFPVPSLSLAALANYHDARIELELDDDHFLTSIRLVRTDDGGQKRVVSRFECSDAGEVWINYYGSRERKLVRQMGGREVVVSRVDPVLETIPAYRLLDAFRVPPDETDDERFRRSQEQERLRRLVQNRVIFVGATALGLSDIRSTPLGEFRPGVESHATVVANALDGTVLRLHPLKETVLQLLSTFVFLVVLAFLMPRMRPLVAAAFFVVVLLVATVWCWVCFRGGSVLWPSEIILPMTVFFGLGMAYLNLIENKEKAWLDGMFKRYVSPEYVEQIKANKGRLDLNGKEENITPFFSDMAKFSTISEAFTAEGLFRFLGEYLGEMADILDQYGGTLDKFEGDAVVAFFGAPIPFEDHAAKACLASLHMHRRIRELEREWQTSDRYPELHQLAEKVGHWFPIRVRIGLNTGPCATGHLGTAERGNYTMMGDTVNLAARLEAAGKQYGIALTISESTYQAAKDVIIARPVDVIQVVGRTVGTPIYEVVAATGDLDEAKERFLHTYNKAWQQYRARAFVEARELYQEALALDPHDQVCKIFIERCREYEASPPPEEWDGVHVMTSK